MEQNIADGIVDVLDRNGEESSKSFGVVGNVEVLQGINGKGEETKKKQFLHKCNISVLCACTACGIRIFEYNRLASSDRFFSRVI